MTEELLAPIADEIIEAPIFATPQEYPEIPDTNTEKEDATMANPKVKVRQEPVCTDPTGNCAECCAIFTNPDLRQRFGYQVDTAVCECHDICVQDVKLICVEELTREIRIPGIDAVVGCRGGRNITGTPELESCRVFCAQEQLVQTDAYACLRVENEIGIEVILKITVNTQEVFLVIRDIVTLECDFNEFYTFPGGVGFPDTPEGREAFREIIKFIDGSCKTIIIEDCRIVTVANNPCVIVDLKVIDKLWKHENLLVSAIRPYPAENVTVKEEFNTLHKIGPCPGPPCGGIG